MISGASLEQVPHATSLRHSRWVRACHWIGAAALLVLVFTGVEILMVHPRLYWGDAGNDLMPALLELPISRNLHHDGIGARTRFFDGPDSPVSAPVAYDMFNQNGWGRSLHFLAGWVLVGVGLVYLVAAIASGHLRHHLAPRLQELAPETSGRTCAATCACRYRRPPVAPPTVSCSASPIWWCSCSHPSWW